MKNAIQSYLGRQALTYLLRQQAISQLLELFRQQIITYLLNYLYRHEQLLELIESYLVTQAYSRLLFRYQSQSGNTRLRSCLDRQQVVTQLLELGKTITQLLELLMKVISYLCSGWLLTYLSQSGNGRLLRQQVVTQFLELVRKDDYLADGYLVT